MRRASCVMIKASKAVLLPSERDHASRAYLASLSVSIAIWRCILPMSGSEIAHPPIDLIYSGHHSTLRGSDTSIQVDGNNKGGDGNGKVGDGTSRNGDDQGDNGYGGGDGGVDEAAYLVICASVDGDGRV
ncbi:hypothetical protein Tco_1291251 [Tanacetum coccineum]